MLAIFKPNYNHLKAMMHAIDEARECNTSGKMYSKTDGLRVIRRFERVNRIKFDPFDKDHVLMVSGWGWNESLLRKLKKT